MKKWRKDNREYILEYQKQWRKDNPNSEKRKIKKYQQSLKGKLAKKKVDNKRRMKFKNIIENYTYNEWFEKVDKTKGICPGYKRNPHFVGKNKLELDHIIPISKVEDGFEYTIDDIQPLCKSCNSSKGNRG